MKKRILKILRRLQGWLDHLQLKALDRQINSFNDDQIVAVIRVIAAKRDMTAYLVTKNSRGQKLLLVNQLLRELGLLGMIMNLNQAEGLLLAAEQEKIAAKEKKARLN